MYSQIAMPILVPEVPVVIPGAGLQEIRLAEERLHAKFANALRTNYDLDRTLVSFQANKRQNGYRWFKYKEGFSAELIRYILSGLGLSSGRILDPFAGSGTTLFVASETGLDAVGIELLPSSAETIEVRNLLHLADKPYVASALRQFQSSLSWQESGESEKFQHLRITAGAFPPDTELELGRYLHEANMIGDPVLRRILRFAAMCVLEDISYTRKDGQYLRWDHRSGRNAGNKPFDKGHIVPFTHAICGKLEQISSDLIGHDRLIPDEPLAAKEGRADLQLGSCLELLPKMEANSFDALVTSPPYCNRYDYTRTYALELAMLGINEEQISALRQTMLSCTVENKEKQGLGAAFEAKQFRESMVAFESQELLQLILSYLDRCRDKGELNNNGIPRMVRNYFKELTVVIFECARLLKPGARFVMVNDNVRYQGVHIPVDLILSDIAQKAGLRTEAIWVLPKGKGNSSQQMGEHGREELRKCVYVWSR